MCHKPTIGNIAPTVKALRTFFACLAHALAFIHSKNIKHMDIKPQNLLVRPQASFPNRYKIYIADFGIARSYKTAQEAYTDSPISYTRTYAPPEVIRQDIRGFSADIFSLGCVFLEMLAVLASHPSISSNERQNLTNIRSSNPKDTSYQANLEAVQTWYQETFEPEEKTPNIQGPLRTLCARMMQLEPEKRPTAAEIDAELVDFRCAQCDEGPEPFEAA